MLSDRRQVRRLKNDHHQKARARCPSQTRHGFSDRDAHEAERIDPRGCCGQGHFIAGSQPGAPTERELRPETSGGEAGLPSQTTPVQEIIDWTGSGARLAACIAGQCRCDFRDRQRQPGADFPRPRPGRFFDGTRPAELLSRCALVIADLSLHPVSFRETFVTRLYRFSTVVSHSVPSSRAVSILSYRLSYLFALRRVWARLSQRIICH